MSTLQSQYQQLENAKQILEGELVQSGKEIAALQTQNSRLNSAQENLVIQIRHYRASMQTLIRINHLRLSQAEKDQLKQDNRSLQERDHYRLRWAPYNRSTSN